MRALLDGVIAAGLLLSVMAAVALGVLMVVGVLYVVYSWADWRGQWLEDHPETERGKRHGRQAGHR